MATTSTEGGAEEAEAEGPIEIRGEWLGEAGDKIANLLNIGLGVMVRRGDEDSGPVGVEELSGMGG
jgi:hypothetical protein